MYIIELVAKLSTKIKNRDFKFLKKQNSQQNEVVEEQSCEHIFVPVDSTKRILACTKCGFMVRVDPNKIKKQNPFEQ